MTAGQRNCSLAIEELLSRYSVDDLLVALHENRIVLGNIDRLQTAIREIDQTLLIPAAEYVPAIGDVFTIIDKLGIPGIKKDV